MKPIRHTLTLIAFLCVLTACTESQMDEALPEKDKPGVTFLLANQTGHSYPGNVLLCGEGLFAVFELKSNVESKNISVISDNFRLASLTLEEGQEVMVQVRDEQGTIVAQNKAVFGSISKTARIQEYHAITLCESEIEFNF